MAVESKRGCGYRKVGGLYLVSGQLSSPCGRLPIELHVCPTCKGGVKQSRGWTWVSPAIIADSECSAWATHHNLAAACPGCPLRLDLAQLGKQVGLLWVGGSFYPEVTDFMREAATLGVSRRIPAVPRGFKVGEHWVLIAHPKAINRCPADPDITDDELADLKAENITLAALGKPQRFAIYRKGVITAFKPTAIEKIVTESQAADAAAMDALAEKGITPVVVPDDDKDHQGSVHDSDDEPDRPLPPMNGQLFARQAE